MMLNWLADAYKRRQASMNYRYVTEIQVRFKKLWYRLFHCSQNIFLYSHTIKIYTPKHNYGTSEVKFALNICKTRSSISTRFDCGLSLWRYSTMQHRIFMLTLRILLLPRRIGSAINVYIRLHCKFFPSMLSDLFHIYVSLVPGIVCMQTYVCNFNLN